mmetsp:Transcript_7321/g.19219  ORF Transcript_7321/g.19219 Transcript_7321/m.19219 type:complete len:102 (+) Transcript_7321:383-688(+)
MARGRLLRAESSTSPLPAMADGLCKEGVEKRASAHEHADHHEEAGRHTTWSRDHLADGDDRVARALAWGSATVALLLRATSTLDSGKRACIDDTIAVINGQ